MNKKKQDVDELADQLVEEVMVIVALRASQNGVKPALLASAVAMKFTEASLDYLAEDVERSMATRPL